LAPKQHALVWKIEPDKEIAEERESERAVDAAAFDRGKAVKRIGNRCGDVLEAHAAKLDGFKRDLLHLRPVSQPISSRNEVVIAI